MSNDADVDAALEQVWGLPAKMRTYGQSRSVVGCSYGGTVVIRPKRMICPRPCGMAPRKAKKRGRREEFGYCNCELM